VSVETNTGVVTVVATGSDTRSFHRPRFSPNGRLIAVAVLDRGLWRVGVVNAVNRSVRILTTDARHYFDPVFETDSTLIATAEENGILNLVRINLDGVVLGRLTNVVGAALAPEVNPEDRSVWFLALHARGWDVRSTSGAGKTGLSTRGTRLPIVLPTSPVGATRRYSPDRRWLYFPTGNVVRDGVGLGLGVVNTDPVGRYELMAQGALSLSPRSYNAPLEGALATLTTRTRLPLTLGAFAVRQGGPFWHSLRGASVSGERTHRVERFSSRLMTGGTWARVRSPLETTSGGVARWLAFGEIGLSATRYHDGKRTTGQLSLHGASGQRDRNAVQRVLGAATISSTEIPLTFTAQLGRVSADAAVERFTIGGNPATLLTPGVAAQFIVQPALPPFFVGSRLETYRLSVPLLGARVYGWAGRAYDAGTSPRLERVLGAEYSASIAAIPALGTPTARITIGAGRWLNHRTVFRQVAADPALYMSPSGKVQVYLTTQFGDWGR
jgi:hypothetical protein